MTYTDSIKIAEYMQLPVFVGKQLTAANTYAQAASNWIDNRTGRSWSDSVVDEVHHYNGGPIIYTANRPVSAISAVKRRPCESVDLTVLTLNEGYYIVNLAQGEIRISSGEDFLTNFWDEWAEYDILISYTTSNPPIDIEQAATMLAAHWMQGVVHPEMQRISRFRAGQSTAADYRPRSIPDEVKLIMEAYPRRVYVK